MEVIRNFFAKNDFRYLYLSLLILGLILFTYQAWVNVYLPYDDVYSIRLIEHSYASILRITANDVHPPLYYWMLKGYGSVFGTSLFSLRFFSVLGVLAILVLGRYPIRRLFGTTTSLFFVGLIIVYPVTQNMAVDIRMYSWTAFFVLACALLAYLALLTNKWRHWLGCTAMALCASYMHNYGLLSVVGIYALLLIHCLYTRINIKQCLLSASIVAICYLPWLLQLVAQMGTIANDYWIQPLTWGDFMLHAYYLYSPKLIEFPFVYFSKLEMIIGVVLVLLTQVALILVYLKKGRGSHTHELKLVLSLFALFCFPILFGVLFSFVAFPILAPRYMLCAFPLLILGLAIVMQQVFENRPTRWLVVVSCIMLVGLSVVRHKVCTETYKNEKRRYERVQQFAKEGDRNLPFVTSNELYFTLSRLSYISPDNDCLILEEMGKLHNYAPFTFDSLNLSTVKPLELILVSHSGEKYRDYFADFMVEWGSVYQESDFMVAGDILLLKLIRE